MMYYIITQIIVLPLAILMGAVLFYITGRILRLDEVTFGGAFGYQVVLVLLNPFVPMLLFLYEYYVGGMLPIPVHPIFRIIIYYSLISGSGILLWYFLAMYIFSWDMGQACIFSITNCCVAWVIWAVIMIVFYGVLFLLGTGLAMSSQGG